MLRSSLVLLACGLATLAAMLLSIFTTYSELGTCSMSYSHRVYYEIEIPSPYSLLSTRYKTYLYREGGVSRHYDGPNALGGVPVLFIPGNAGSFEQGRSLGALAAELSKEWDSETIFDFFMLDFDEDLSALHGKTLMDQAQYTNDVIFHLLKLYTQNTESRFLPPTSVIVIGHSMGGIVARTIVTLDNFVPNSVNTIYTLSTPNIVPPLTFDRDVTEVYDNINLYWRNTFDNSTKKQQNPEVELNALEDLSIVSISGGHTDFMVPPDYTPIDSLVPPTHGISAFTYSIPNVWRGVDHLAIMWCAELRQVVIESMFAIASPDHTRRTLALEERVTTLQSYFRSPMDSLPENATLEWQGPDLNRGTPNSVRTPVGSITIHAPEKRVSHDRAFPVTRTTVGNAGLLKLLLLGVKIPLEERFVDADLPAVKSSLVSLRVKVERACKVQTVHDSKLSQLPLAIRHWTPTFESRWYEGDDVRVFWYSRAPFTPFPKHTQHSLHLQFLTPHLCASGPSHYATVSIDVWATLANIAFRYRTAAVTYTFAIIIMCMLIQLHLFYGGKLISFTRALEIFVSRYLLYLCVVVAVMHSMLSYEVVRDGVRLLQWPSERKTIASLEASRISYDIHEILAGLNDVTLVWVPVFLILFATFLCLLVDRLLFIIVLSKCWVGSALTRLRRATFGALARPGKSEPSADDKRRLEEKDAVQTLSSGSPASAPSTPAPSGWLTPVKLATNALGLLILFYVPYQVAFIFLTASLLLTINANDMWKYTFLIIFLWTSIVNGPIIVVWFRNFSLEWALAFSSIGNVLAVAPSVLLVNIMGQRPNPIPPLKTRSALRIATYAILGYVSYYSLMHGIMHTFMLHHLVNYTSVWMIVLYIDSALTNSKHP